MFCHSSSLSPMPASPPTPALAKKISTGPKLVSAAAIISFNTSTRQTSPATAIPPTAAAT